MKASSCYAAAWGPGKNEVGESERTGIEMDERRGGERNKGQRAGIVGLVRPRRMGGSGEVDAARAALCLLEVVAGDVIPPSRLGRRGDLAVAPSRSPSRYRFSC